MALPPPPKTQPEWARAPLRLAAACLSPPLLARNAFPLALSASALMLLSSQALAQTAEDTEHSEARNAVALAPVTVHGEATSVNDTLNP